MSNVKLTLAVDGRSGWLQMPYEVIHFPSGEITVRFNQLREDKRTKIVGVNGQESITTCPDQPVTDISGAVRYTLSAIGVTTPEDVFIVQAAREWLQSQFMCENIELACPYLPSARQDRVAVDGDVCMLRVYFDILSRGFTRVFSLDVHSLASEILVDRNMTVANYLSIKALNTSPMRGVLQGVTAGYTVLVAPDNGALKRVEQVAKRFGGKAVAYGIKHRNPVDGSITSYDIVGDVAGKACLIIDDICDGGRTFTECAAKLRESGATHITLYVSHGLFTKGLDVLLDNGIDAIYTTSSTGFVVPEGYEDRVFVI